MASGGQLHELSWPASRLGDALQGLLPPSRHGLTRPILPGRATNPMAAHEVSKMAEQLGMAATPLSISYRGIESALSGSKPLVVELSGSTDRFLLLAGSRKGQLQVLVQDGSHRSIPLKELATALRQPAEATVSEGVERLLARTGIQGRQREKARKHLLLGHLAQSEVTTGWKLELPPGARLTQQAKAAGLPALLGAFFATHTLQMILLTVSWWFLWKGGLSGGIDWGWLAGWCLAVGTSYFPFGLLASWYLGLISVRTGRILRRRTLAGAHRLEPDELRAEGVGSLLGRALETDTVEKNGVLGVLSSLSHFVDLVVVAPILLLGIGGWPHLLLLVICIAALLTGIYRYRTWYAVACERRHELTLDLVEKIMGNQTRVVQLAPDLWHQREDRTLQATIETHRRSDRWEMCLGVFFSNGWVFLSLLLLLPEFLYGDATSGRLVLSLGAILLIRRSLALLAQTLLSSVRTSVAWRWVSLLSHAAERPKILGVDSASGVPASGSLLLMVEDLCYRYPSRPLATLNRCSLDVHRGDRILLEGPSGGGKSTLATLLSSLRRPDSGLLLLDGLDLSTHGSDEWRRRIALTPQFHENHIFLETLAFNLLVGRRWPPSPSDLQEAREVCEEIGLGELIRRMPAGLDEQIGEVGWQLSHGERSRVFIARSILQRADLLILDESLSALDPGSLRQTMNTVFRRAPSLLVIAHP